MKKKIISLLLAVVMIVGMLPLSSITAFAADDEYPIILDERKSYKISNATYNLSGKQVSQVYEISDGAYVVFENVTFENVTGDNGCCVYIDLDDGLSGVVFYNCKFINCTTTGNGIVYVNNITAPYTDIVFDDCTIENCHADNGNGGFLYVNDGDAEVIFNRTTFEKCSAKYGGVEYIQSCNYPTEFNDCIVTDCSASVYGGFVYTDDAEASVKCSNTVISGCHAEDGGAFYMHNGESFVFENGCAIVDCHVDDNGGAIYINDADGEVYGNGIHEEDVIPADLNPALVISGCSAEYGGGVYVAKGQLVDDIVFSDNTATYDGGGLYNYTLADTDCTIFNCRFIHNKAGNADTKRYGGGLYANDLTGKVKSCTFYENTAYGSGADLYANSFILYCTFTSLFSYDDKTKDIYSYNEYDSVIMPQSSYTFDSNVNGDGTQGNPYRINDIKDWEILYFMSVSGNLASGSNQQKQIWANQLGYRSAILSVISVYILLSSEKTV